MIRTRRKLKAELAEARTELADARIDLGNARDRAAQAEGERDAYRDELDDADRRARAWRALYRGAAASRDELATAITGEQPAPAGGGMNDVRRALGIR